MILLHSDEEMATCLINLHTNFIIPPISQLDFDVWVQNWTPGFRLSMKIQIISWGLERSQFFRLFFHSVWA